MVQKKGSGKKSRKFVSTATLKIENARLKAENVRLKKIVALSKRKAEHGCTDANCSLCTVDIYSEMGYT